MSLRFKREELKRLWLEDIKYKHMLQTIQAVYVERRRVVVDKREGEGWKEGEGGREQKREREGGGERGERERETTFSCFSRDEVRNVPDQLLEYTRRKHYLHATELLNNSGMLLALPMRQTIPQQQHITLPTCVSLSYSFSG